MTFSNFLQFFENDINFLKEIGQISFENRKLPYNILELMVGLYHFLDNYQNLYAIKNSEKKFEKEF